MIGDMKTASAIIVLLLTLSCAQTDNKTAPAGPAYHASSTSPVPTIATPKDGNYDAKGKVTKINMELGSVELDHEAIPAMPMAKMIMEFYVKDKAELEKLKVGDNVDFVLEYKHPTYTIVSIKKAS